ncbi:hypothetical protein T484DRAFT_1829560 [Baffinella frigidus]|nr:hypothetical protein T484DRAFT_1829560 [Cryptophyta sp. CCMP2293]
MVKLRERAGSVPSTLVMLICAVRVCDALPQAHLSSDMRTLLGPPTSSVMLESKQGRCSAGVAAGGRGGGVREGCSLLAMRGGSDYAGMASSAAAFATPEVAKSVITSVSGSSVLTNPRNIGLMMIAGGLVLSMFGFMLFMNVGVIEGAGGCYVA